MGEKFSSREREWERLPISHNLPETDKSWVHPTSTSFCKSFGNPPTEWKEVGGEITFSPSFLVPAYHPRPYIHIILHNTICLPKADEYCRETAGNPFLKVLRPTPAISPWLWGSTVDADLPAGCASHSLRCWDSCLLLLHSSLSPQERLSTKRSCLALLGQPASSDYLR